MKPKEIRALTIQEINAKLLDVRDQLFKLTFRTRTNLPSNPLQIRKFRREIARILTILKEKRSTAG